MYGILVAAWVITIAIAYSLGRRNERRKSAEPVLYTNGRWLYAKDRRDKK